MRDSLIAVLALAIGVVPCSAVVAAPPPEMVRLLIPLTVRGASGAYGSQWETELFLVVKKQLSLRFNLDPSCLDPPCPPNLFITSVGRPNPLGFYPTKAGQTPGSYMYVGADQVNDVEVLAFIRETTRGRRALQLPVVADRSFSASTLYLLKIPSAEGARTTLRIYAPSPLAAGLVRVRLRSSFHGGVLREGTYPLEVVQVFDTRSAEPSQQLPLRPPVAQITDITSGIAPAVEDLFIEITPLTTDLKIWAFASVTDNVTQEVFLRTPEPLPAP